MTTVPRAPRPCLDCQTPTTNPGQRCDQHKRSKRHYHTPDWAKARTLALRLGYHQCAVCARTEQLHVHHINHAARDHRQDNLIVLCAHHHMQLEREWTTGARHGPMHKQLAECVAARELARRRAAQ